MRAHAHDRWSQTLHFICKPPLLNISFAIFIAVDTLIDMLSSFSVLPPTRTFLIKHYSGLCVAMDAQSVHFVLTSSCDQKFSLISNKNLKHIKSGKCVVPESTRDNAFIKLDDDCSSSNSRFIQTNKYSAKHIATGKCIHPHGGWLRPKSGTRIVIYRGCDENRLQFKFIYGKAELDSSSLTLSQL